MEYYDVLNYALFLRETSIREGMERYSFRNALNKSIILLYTTTTNR